MGLIYLPYTDYPETTWENRPLKANTYQIIKVTDIGPADELFFWTGSRWAPVNGNIVIASTNTSSSVTGTTSETELGSFVIPGGLMSSNGILEVSSFWAVTNSANSKVIRIKLSETTDPVTTGTNFLSRTETSVLYHQHMLIIRNNNSTSAQVSAPVALGTGFGTSTSTYVSAAVDMATNKKMYLSGILTNTGESVTLRGYRVVYRE
ncbi:MAG: hypothetical protein AB7I27_00305 [Bacteriovoracaceae bacterium]